MIRWEDGHFAAVDLGSTNGTFVNGRRLAPEAPCPLRSGDRLSFGGLELELHALAQGKLPESFSQVNPGATRTNKRPATPRRPTDRRERPPHRRAG